MESLIANGTFNMQSIFVFITFNNVFLRDEDGVDQKSFWKKNSFNQRFWITIKTQKKLKNSIIISKKINGSWKI